MDAKRRRADSYDVLPCDRVVTIPQYIGTCWFNALLMAVFYSEAVRDVVVAARDARWEPLRRSPNAYMRKVVRYFEHILRLYKRPKDRGAYKFYDKITPERILYYLHKADPKNMEYDAITRDQSGKYVLREGLTAGYHAYLYVHKFLTFLKVRNISLTAVPITKGDHRGPFRLSIGDQHSRSRVDFAKAKMKNGPAYSYSIKDPNHVRSLFYSRPEVLVVDIARPKNLWTGTKRPEYYYLPGTHRNLPGFIRLGQTTYVLDSCTFSIDNAKETVYSPKGEKKTITGGHSITGVTCNRRKFIYSGWMKKTVDKARGNENRDDDDGGIGATKRPCPLMPFDWSKDPRSFYITAKVCQVQFEPPNYKSLRFNALRGPRMYLYVRRDLVHYKRHAIQRLKNAAKSGDKARVVRLGFSVAKQTVADALRRKARIDRAARTNPPPTARRPPTRRRR